MICRGAGGVIAVIDGGGDWGGTKHNGRRWSWLNSEEENQEGEKEIWYAEELVELSPELMEEDSKPPHEVEEEKKRRREEVKRQLVAMVVDEKTKQRWNNWWRL